MWLVSNPPRRQTLAVLGTPGKGVTLQSAKAHWSFAMSSRASFWWTRRVRVAPALLVLTASYAGGDVALPSDPGHRVALGLEKPVARVGGVAADVQVGDALVSAVHHVVDERAVGAGHVDRLEDRDHRLVLDHAAPVSRGQLDVRDHLVERVLRVHLAECDAVEDLVLTNAAERSAVEGR